MCGAIERAYKDDRLIVDRASREGGLLRGVDVERGDE